MAHTNLPRFSFERPALLAGITLLALSAPARAQDVSASSAVSSSSSSATQLARASRLEFASIAAGPSYSCAITSDQRVACWGAIGGFPGTARGSASQPAPVVVPGVSRVSSLTVGASAACAVRKDNSALCWNSGGKLFQLPFSDVKTIALGQLSVCALLRDGSVYCTPDAFDFNTFNYVPFGRRVKSLSTSNGYHMCGLAEGGGEDEYYHDDEYYEYSDDSYYPDEYEYDASDDRDRVMCFGTGGFGNFSGTLGNLGSDRSFEPREVREVRGARQLAVGWYHSCALLEDEVYCWGSNQLHELGPNGPEGFDPYSATPVKVTGLSSPDAVGAGLGQSCTLQENGRVYCWGDAYGAQPRKINDLPKSDRLSNGNDFACSMSRDGKAYCWGNNDFYELGNAEFRDDNGVADVFPPRPVLGQ